MQNRHLCNKYKVMANIKQKTTKSKKLQKSIYLDYASNTPVDTEVLAVINKASGVYFGNPSALYKEGVLAKEALSLARKDVAKVFDICSNQKTRQKILM